jgi:hypothetical protein
MNRLGCSPLTSHLRRLLLLVHLYIVRVQMLQRMRTWDARPAHPGWHSSQHCSTLCHLWSRARHAHMHLPRHARPWLTTTLLWMTRRHWVTWANTRMLLETGGVWRVCLSHTSHHSAVEPRRGYRGAPCTCSQLSPPPPSSRLYNVASCAIKTFLGSYRREKYRYPLQGFSEV